MKKIIDFIMGIDFSALLLFISSSGAIGAWIGYKSEKKRAEKDLELQKKSYEATIQQMEKEFELATRQKQLEWDHEKQLLQGTLDRAHVDRMQLSYNAMVEALTDYINMSTPVSKSKAESEIRKFAVVADEGLYPLIDQLDDAVSTSNPFDGPNEQTVKALINLLRPHVLK